MLSGSSNLCFGLFSGGAIGRFGGIRQELIQPIVIDPVVLTKELDGLLEYLVPSRCGKTAQCAVKGGVEDALGGEILRQGVKAEDGKQGSCTAREQREPLLGKARPLDQCDDGVADDANDRICHILFSFLMYSWCVSVALGDDLPSLYLCINLIDK